MLKFRESLDSRPVYSESAKSFWKLKLDANEKTKSFSEKILRDVLQTLENLKFNLYPTTEQETSLRAELGSMFSLPFQNVWLGNGSSEIIEKVFYAFGGANAKIIYPVPSFSMYEIYANVSDGEGIPFVLNEKNFSLDVEKLFDCAKKNKAGLVVVCNPNNPTGNFYEKEKLLWLCEELQKINCALLIDEAYIEFHDYENFFKNEGKSFSCADAIATHENLLVARTFSKAFGMAGCRVGYLLANEKIIQAVQKTFMPYSLNVMSLEVARAMLKHRQEIYDDVKTTVSEREKIFKIFSERLNDFQVVPSCTNFIFLRSTSSSEKFLQKCLAEKISIRHFSSERLKNALRISIGTPEENKLLLQALFGDDRF